MNPRQRRGVFLMVLAALSAILVFIGVSSYVANVNSKVGPMVTVYRVTKDLPAFTTLWRSPPPRSATAPITACSRRRPTTVLPA